MTVKVTKKVPKLMLTIIRDDGSVSRGYAVPGMGPGSLHAPPQASNAQLAELRRLRGEYAHQWAELAEDQTIAVEL